MAKDKLAIIYADTETYDPSRNPLFWYGGFMSEDGKFKAYYDFESFFKGLIKPIPGKEKVVVFHNASYDMGIIMYQANKELGYKLNPKRYTTGLGARKAIYSGQTWEIYDENRHVTRIVDSLPLINISIRAMGYELNKQGLGSDLLKGETPIVDSKLEVKPEWLEYLKTDINILRVFSQKVIDLKEDISHGILTTSSRVQASVYERMHGRKRPGGLKTRHKPIKVKDSLPFPKSATQLRKALLDKYECFGYGSMTEEEKMTMTQAERKKLAFVDPKTSYNYPYWYMGEKETREYKDKINAYLGKLFTHEYGKDFRKWQKEPTDEFWSLPLPAYNEDDLPTPFKIVDKRDNHKILEYVNSYAHRALRGGISYVNPKYQNKELGAGLAIDANSMYPSIALDCVIPYRYCGRTQGLLDEGKSKYYIAEIKRLHAKVKKGKMPWLKGSTRYMKNVYGHIYDGEIDWKTDNDYSSELCLTSVDINYMYETYNVIEIEFGWVFYYEPNDDFTHAIRSHTRFWRKVKESSPDGSPERFRAKMNLNTLWGRWGMFAKQVDLDGSRVDVGDKETNLVSACFMTAYARVRLNRMCNRFADQFVYSDTDSVHIVLKEGQTKADVEKQLGPLLDPKKFGCWKVEDEWDACKYVKPKTYIHLIKNGTKHVDPITNEVHYFDKFEVTGAGITRNGVNQLLGIAPHEDELSYTDVRLNRLEAPIKSVADFRAGLEYTEPKSKKLPDNRTVIRTVVKKL